MNFKNCLWSLALVCITIPALAHSNTTLDEGNKSSKALTEIQSLISKLDLNYEELDNQTVKVHFMVTTKNEVVVLRTNHEDVDQSIKFGLNYKEIKNMDLEVNKVYILPISFKAENT